jgi:hypothetical protein
MRRFPPLVLLLAVLLVGSACGVTGEDDAGGGGGETTTEETTTEETTTTEESTTTTELPDDDDDAAQLLVDAADATLTADRMTIDSEAVLGVGPQTLRLAVDGSVDYASLEASVVLSFEQAGETQEIEVRSDGDQAWIRAEGGDSPPFPDGRSWVVGDAERLTAGDSFAPSGLIGVLLALRATTEAEAGDTEEIDDVETRRYTTRVLYDDAVDAAGPDAAAFTAALSLTGSEDIALDIDVWIGDDGVIRRFQLVVDTTDPISGTYDIDITDVGEEVDDVDEPDEDDVVSGPEAEDLLDQLIG